MDLIQDNPTPSLPEPPAPSGSLPQPKKTFAKPLLVGLAATLVVGAIGALFIYTRLPAQPTEAPARAKQPLESLGPALDVTVQSFYQNPFDPDTTYVNPFSTYQNPFAQNTP